MKNYKGFLAEELPDQEMKMLYSLLGKEKKIKSGIKTWSFRHLISGV